MMLTITTALLLAALPCPVSARWTEGMPVGNGVIEPARNVIAVKGTDLTWNDKPMGFDTLVATAKLVPGFSPRPWLILDASAADCATLQRVTAAVEDAAQCDADNCFLSRKPVPPEPPAATVVLPRQ